MKTNAHRLITTEGEPEERISGSRTDRIIGRARVNIIRPTVGTCSACEWRKDGSSHRIVENAFYREHLYPLALKEVPT